MPILETWLVLLLFCSTSSSYCLELVEPSARFQPVPICYGPEGRTNCGFGEEEVTVLAHVLWAHAVTLFSFVLGRRHVRNTLSVGSSRYLAHCGPWLAACCSGWRAGGHAGNQGCSKPNNSLAPALDQHSRGKWAGPLRTIPAPSQHILLQNSLGKSHMTVQ